jgi:hypothetical protein
MELGIVLAVLPLIVSTAEHWDDVLLPFKTYRRYATELDQFQRSLKVQKTIFNNECCLLMAVCTGRDTARAMLSDRRHSHWTNRELDRKLGQLLGDSLETCQYTINSIQLKLKELEKKEESSLAEVQQDVPVSMLSFGQFYLVLRYLAARFQWKA